MCGRYASFRQAQDLADAFALYGVVQGVLFGDEVTGLPASWNVAPTDRVRIVVDRPTAGASTKESFVDDQADVRPALRRSLRLARWGLVPSWARDPSGAARLINARSETVREKPSFAEAFAARRCLVPAEGYYEWPAPAPGAPRGPRRPVFIRPADGSVLAMAGLYEFWRDPALPADHPDRWLVTTTILTTAATGDLADVHERRPVVLPPEAWDAWLDPRTGADEASRILAGPCPALTFFPVGTAVNRVGTQGPALVEPEEAA